MKETSPPSALTIAGSDSGAGAGIQADLKAMARIGVHACTVITALTAQNTRGVQGIQPVGVEFVEKQLASVLSDVSLKAVKTGMLFGAEIIELVARRALELPNLVVDPVMVAESGDSLLQKEAEEMLVEKLLPRATLVTPNWPEAEVIARRLGLSLELDVETLGRKMVRSLSGPAILIKGGHRSGEQATDLLFDKQTDEVKKIAAPRIQTANTHGSGCALSSFITAFLARGLDMDEALQQAKQQQTTAIAESYSYGAGPGTLNLLEQ